MYYKHFFICAACKGHVVDISDSPQAVSPGRTHYLALENGGQPPTKHGATTTNCMGVMMYCAGFDKNGVPCGGNHPKGTEQYQDPPPPPPNPDWDEFANRVHAAWQAYVNSGYSMAYRGPNHDKAHKTKPAVSRVLQQSGGLVNIRGGLYSTSISLTTDASIKRNAGGHATFIYHL